MAVDGVQGRGVAVLLKQGVECLGSMIENHWVIAVIRDGSLGDFIVTATYLPTWQPGAGPVMYWDYWMSMLESSQRM